MKHRALTRLGGLTAVVALVCAAAAEAQTAPAPDPHAGHAGHQQAGPPAPGRELPPFISPVTEDDRQAAFPDVDGHATHDRAMHWFVLFDQLEWRAASRGSGVNLGVTGWLGGDRNRVWFRAEGESEDGRVGQSQAQVLYGHQVSRWWDLVAGVRQDFRPGSAQAWAAAGIQGLAPYWFEIEATAYVGAAGRAHARLEAEYELLLTNRLILQPRVEVHVAGRSDPERGIGAGVSTTEAGIRVRYEFRRELAPYVGVVWSDAWGKTADIARATGTPKGGAHLVTGLRLWF